MRNLATATGTMHYATGFYAQSLMELQEKGYIVEVARFLNDGWGNAFLYRKADDTESYTLTSYGSDGEAGPAPPDPWRDEPYEPDIVLSDGMFTQAPTGQ